MTAAMPDATQSLIIRFALPGERPAITVDAANAQEAAVKFLAQHGREIAPGELRVLGYMHPDRTVRAYGPLPEKYRILDNWLLTIRIACPQTVTTLPNVELTWVSRGGRKNLWASEILSVLTMDVIEIMLIWERTFPDRVSPYRWRPLFDVLCEWGQTPPRQTATDIEVVETETI